MKFDIITIFPDIFNSYFNESILARARKNKLIKIKIHNLRDYTDDKRRTVDDTPYGGGAGMILKIEPIYKALVKIAGRNKLKFIKHALESHRGSKVRKAYKIKNNPAKTKIILLSAKGKKFDQAMARKFSKLERIIFVCGRYEGVDERAAKYLCDEEISIGDYILTGGELPATVMIDAITRLIPGALGNAKSLEEESFPADTANAKQKSKRENLEYPQYTKPEIFSPDKKTSWRAPKVLLSGNHGLIKKWRESKRK